MEREIKGRRLCETYLSMDEFAATAEKRALKGTRDYTGTRPSFFHVGSFGEALSLARDGWTEKLPEAMAIAESAVEMSDQEHMTDTFQPVWDVTGAEVDVARYLSGEPECMIDFPLSKTSKVGRVITLVVSTTISSAISTDTYVRRGYSIVALALALSRLGHAIEIWNVDHTTSNTDPQDNIYTRVLTKGAHDELDAARLMFALAHPAMQRAICWAIRDGFPEPWRKGVGRDAHRGRPVNTVDDKAKALYPEGTIFIPGILSGTDIQEPEEFLRKYLGELGLLAE